MTCLSAHMYRQISKCTDKNPKKHYWGGGGAAAPPAPPPLATLMWCSVSRYVCACSKNLSARLRSPPPPTPHNGFTPLLPHVYVIKYMAAILVAILKLILGAIWALKIVDPICSLKM